MYGESIVKTAGRKKSTNIQDLRGGDNANPLTRFQHSMDVVIRSQAYSLREDFGMNSPNIAFPATRKPKRNGPR